MGKLTNEELDKMKLHMPDWQLKLLASQASIGTISHRKWTKKDIKMFGEAVKTHGQLEWTKLMTELGWDKRKKKIQFHPKRKA